MGNQIELPMYCHNFSLSNHQNEIPRIDFMPSTILLFSTLSKESITPYISQLRAHFTTAQFIGCSTSGDISDGEVRDNSVSVLCLRPERGRIEVFSDRISGNTSYQAGLDMAKNVPKKNLAHLFILSEGLDVNGSELANGLRDGLPSEISVTGGLAGDESRFQSTWVLDERDIPRSNGLSVMAFYGNWEIGFGSTGGWDSFGLERIVTKSKNNVLYEIDHKPALDLYKSFLGAREKELPASRLLFPLSMRINGNEAPVVRTILSINEEDKSLIFAGDIPENSYVKLMKANIDRLVNGAENAARVALESIKNKPELSILISCVGRRLVLKQLVEEEIETVNSSLSARTSIGFYSYGELAPFSKGQRCELHNQTMTVTTIREL